jgi:hypothetical protein
VLLQLLNLRITTRNQSILFGCCCYS